MPSVVDFDSAQDDTGVATSITSPAVTFSGSDRCALVHVGMVIPATLPSSVTVDGNACTLIGSKVDEDSGIFAIASYRRVAPNTGNLTATANFADPAVGFFIELIALDGVDQTTPFGSPDSDWAADGAPTSCAPASAVGDLVITSCLGFTGGSGMTPSGSQVEMTDLDPGGFALGSSRLAATAGTTTMGYAANAGQSVLIAAAVKAAAGGGGSSIAAISHYLSMMRQK